MAWYKTGTVTVTLNQTSVTGQGTNFATNARVGDGFRGPDGDWYEITNIASQTVLAIYPAYKGPTTATSANYMIAPIQGYNKESADRLRAITDGVLDTKQDVNANLTSISNLTGVADRLMYFTGPGAVTLAPLTAKGRTLLSRTTGAQLRSDLELGTAATATVGIGTTPDTGLLKSGDFGIGAAIALAGGTDLNSLVIPGDYAFTSGAALVSSPEATAQFVTVIGRLHYPYQEVRAVYGNRIWSRSAKTVNPTTAAHWNDWVRIGDLVTGDFGVGGLVGNSIGDNADTITRSGRYTTPSVWTGSPIAGVSGSNQGYLVHDQNIITTYALQKWYPLAGSVLVPRWRRKVLGVWEAWQLSAMETGSNANGSYTKYPDGTLEQWGTFQETPVTAISGFYGTTSGNIFYINTIISMPIAFLNTNFVIFGHARSRGIVGLIAPQNTSQASTQLRNNISTAEVNLSWFAKGFWK